MFLPEHSNGSLIVALTLGATPAVVEGIRQAQDVYRVAVGMHPGGLSVNGVQEDLVEAFLRDVKASLFAKPVHTPYVYHRGEAVVKDRDTLTQVVRFSAAGVGQELTALVDISGVDTNAVAREVAGIVGVGGMAGVGEADPPADQAYRPMVDVKVDKESRAALQTCLATGQCVLVGHHDARMFPPTHIRATGVSMVVPGEIVRETHEAISSWPNDVRRAGGSFPHSAVVLHFDDKGEPCVDPSQRVRGT